MCAHAAEQLLLSDFDYALPESLIAQQPVFPRDASRLMVIDRGAGAISHSRFSRMGELLRPGDLLVVNNTRVIPCRLPARRRGGGKAEVFLVAEQGINRWEALVRGAGGPGRTLLIGNDSGISAEIVSAGEGGTVTVRFTGTPDIRAELSRIGRTPLPPYIRRQADDADRERYQTVFARRDGAAAAPTAGLHFTDELLAALRSKSVEIAAVTLHVGPGTFQPIREEQLARHRMHPERYEVAEDAALSINRARDEGRRIIAVGTTCVRTLESAADPDGSVAAGSGQTSLFIVPGYRFRTVDGMITNFHLPRSTLLLLVAAFAGRERMLDAYRSAVEAGYRFYSYGDAMLIL